MKRKIITTFSTIDEDYLLKIVDIKNPLQSTKDLYQIYKILEDLCYINKKKFLYFDKITELRELLMINELTGSPSNINNKQYLDELLLKLN